MDRGRSQKEAGQGGAGIDALSQALGRANLHAQRALSEGIAAARALLDIASLGVWGAPAESNRSLGEIAKMLDQLTDTLAGDPDAASRGPLRAVLDSLEVQIARWEERSHDDPDARAVLRLFLGLREVLWEFGLRPSDAAEKQTPDLARTPASAPSRRSRVQRVDIRG